MSFGQSVKYCVRLLLQSTRLYPVHIGAYIRELYFWRELRRLPVLKFRRALDAGCGSGCLARELARRYDHLMVVGYDIKAEFIKEALPLNLHLEHKDLLELRERQEYDFVYSIDVLEHIPGNERVVQNIWHALKHGGYFFLHMPRDNAGKRIFPEHFFRKFDTWLQEEHIGEQYELEEASDLLRRHGFKIVTQVESFGYIGQIAWELDRITDDAMPLKIALMPLLRALAHLAVVRPFGPGEILLVGRKMPFPPRVDRRM